MQQHLSTATVECTKQHTHLRALQAKLIQLAGELHEARVSYQKTVLRSGVQSHARINEVEHRLEELQQSHQQALMEEDPSHHPLQLSNDDVPIPNAWVEFQDLHCALAALASEQYELEEGLVQLEVKKFRLQSQANNGSSEVVQRYDKTGRYVCVHALAMAEASAWLVCMVVLHMNLKSMPAAGSLVPTVLKGLESILQDGLVEGTTLWDFAQHSQRPAHNNFCEQVTAVQGLALPQSAWQRGSLKEARWRGRVWLLLSLSTRTLRPALLSLADIRSSYYDPDAFLCRTRGWCFLIAVLKQLELLKFALTAGDVLQFD